MNSATVEACTSLTLMCPRYGITVEPSAVRAVRAVFGFTVVR